MKILQLRFLNLNSLLGEWQLDLTDPAFGNEGIFAITGPTGAGKSTILDAICLALYGRTPRLSKITKSSNEIMSRHSGECFAEITFETPAGQFRCHWSQHRARKKASGDLQAPKHEIADARSGKIIEAKIRNVAERIEAITGMDFERFTLSMLLAQGRFAAFLQASPDQRAPILEQITGSAIYSQISTRVHELRSTESHKLNTLRAELAGMALLSREDEALLKIQLDQQTHKETELNQQHKQYCQAIEWLQTIDKLQDELQLIDHQKQDLLTRRHNFKASEETLAAAMRAQQLAADYARLCALRKAQNDERAMEQQCLQALPAKQEALKRAENKAQKTKDVLSENRHAQQITLPIIRQTQAFDLKIQAQEASLNKAATDIQTLEHGIAQLQGLQQNSRAQLAEDDASLATLSAQIATSQADKALVDQLSGLQGQFASLRTLKAQCRAKTVEQDHAKSVGQQALKQWQQRSSELAAQGAELQQLEGRLSLEEGERATTLAGREIGDWRETQTNLLARGQLFTQLSLQLKTLTQSQHVQSTLIARQSELVACISASQQGLTVQTEKQGNLKRELDLLETQLALLNKIQSLEQAREQLAEGEPCPLCGADEHPYAEGNIPHATGDSDRLKAVRTTLSTIEQALIALQISTAENTKELEQISQQQRLGLQQIKEQQALVENSKAGICESGFALVNDDELPALLAQYQADNQGLLDETNQRLTSLDQQDQALTALRRTIETVKHTTNELEQKRLTASHKKDSAEQTFARGQKENAVLAEHLQQQQQDVLARVSVYGITTLPSDDFTALESTLIQRRELWLARQLEKQQLDKSIASLALQIQHQSQQVNEKNKELEKYSSTQIDLLSQLETLKLERSTLFAEKDPSQEEARFSCLISDAEKQHDEASLLFQNASEENTKLGSQIKAITDSLNIRARQLSNADDKFQQGLGKYSFTSEVDYQSACISEETRNKLASEAEHLKTEQSGLDARHKDRSASLKSEGEKQITDRPIASLKQDLESTSKQLKSLQQELGACQQKFDDNQKLRASQQQRVTAIDGQKIECQRWDNLHLLIGSADGKKYRNFAQGLTFELLVAHANRQLQKMSDRYLLIRDRAEPLELNVVDNYQAGEIRSTKNLSGGESFIVSLALALGLSQMASKNVRVDSLFLDEGFGTLDEDALDTALEALSSLQQSGKLIGVISHVSSLKERIGTQIQISPQTGGRSLITGPGCSRLS